MSASSRNNPNRTPADGLTPRELQLCLMAAEVGYLHCEKGMSIQESQRRVKQMLTEPTTQEGTKHE
jgi:hypothetical protein